MSLENGFCVEPAVLAGYNKTRIFQEEISGPVLSITTVNTIEEAPEISNDTPSGLGAGVCSRKDTEAYRLGRGIKAGRVWTTLYHPYPAGAAFGGCKGSGFGREPHKMMFDRNQQTQTFL